MILAGGRVALNATESVRINIQTDGKRIVRIGGNQTGHKILDLSGFLILPGLINAHDHLEFNLFPRLGGGTYSNATQWARGIYKPLEAPVSQQLRVPQSVRLIWGGIKNLLSGVTTVSHHNPYKADVFEDQFPVRVVRRFGWAHSLRFCTDVRERFRNTPRGAPFIIHAGEGKDAQSRDEIHQLEKLQILTRSTVIIHGVAFKSEDIALIRRRGVSLVWCPSSNRFTLGCTLSKEILNSGIPIALGSDSALTAEGDFVDELCAARRDTNLVTLYKMVTENAARILRLRFGEGGIRAGGVADLVAIKDNGQTPAETLEMLRPELVILGGRIRLFSEDTHDRLPRSETSRFNFIEVEGRGRGFIDLPAASLAQEAKRELGDSFQLARRKVVV